MSLNKHMIIGNLGRDPEMRFTKTDRAVCTLSVATTHKYKSGEEWVEETTWHRVVVWGNQAEACGKHLSKGRQVYVEGRIQTRSYDDKDGVKKYSTETVAERVQFLGKREDRDGPTNDTGSSDPFIDDDDDGGIPF